MATRWTITFRTIKEKMVTVSVDDPTYTGASIPLTPAENAFSVSRKASSLIEPIMSESGYLRIIDNGIADEHIEEMHPEGAFDRKVTVTVDDVLEWVGYISPETYSAAFAPAPNEVEFPVIGVLDSLKNKTLTDNGTDLELIGEYLREILGTTGFSFSDVIFPRQMQNIVYNTLFNPKSDCPELRLQVSRYNFLEPNDSDNTTDEEWTPFIGDDYYTILSEICKYFGWTASVGTHDGQLSLILTSPRTDITDYRGIPVIELGLLRILAFQPTIVDYERSEITDLYADGTQHRKSITNGYKRVTVVTDLKENNDVTPRIDYDGEILRTYDTEFNLRNYSQNEGVNAQLQLLKPADSLIKLHSYAPDNTQQGYSEVSWTVPGDEEMVLPTAQVVKANTWLDSEDITNYNYRKMLRISLDRSVRDGAQRYGDHFDADVPMASILSRGAGAFTKGMALAINATVFGSYWTIIDGATNETAGIPFKDALGLTQWNAFNNDLRVSLRIGSRWYNGRGGWSSSEVIFPIHAGADNESDTIYWPETRKAGKILDTKTLNMPWEGATGYIVPINQNITGQMELTFYPWHKVTPSEWAIGVRRKASTKTDMTALFIENLSIVVLEPDDNIKMEGVKLSLPTGRNYSEDLTVRLRMTTLKEGRITHSLLRYWGNPAIGDGVVITYPGGYKTQPENWLKETLLKCYTNPSVRLELEVQYHPSLMMYDFVKIGGLDYIITGIDTDYESEHSKITLVRYE